MKRLVLQRPGPSTGKAADAAMAEAVKLLEKILAGGTHTITERQVEKVVDVVLPETMRLPHEQIIEIGQILERAVAAAVAQKADHPPVGLIEATHLERMSATLIEGFAAAVRRLPVPRPPQELPDHFDVRVIEAPAPAALTFPDYMDVKVRTPVDLTEATLRKLAEVLRGAITIVAGGGGGLMSTDASSTATAASTGEIEADLDTVLDDVHVAKASYDTVGAHVVLAAGSPLEVTWFEVQADADNVGQVVATVTMPTGDSYDFPLIASQPMVRSRHFVGAGGFTVTLDVAEKVWVNVEYRLP